ncbi:hypothetical protein [Robertkochia sediminum]|uniref:hypothetical protein n=1 Tax=Robertkochia sediminum TaxID=2785326 RepID=UPI0019313172|nr:hypothetical protein [Robertkochia sediminum]MBL7473099.1 hypothetical protein [Robertkochia sediminum]
MDWFLKYSKQLAVIWFSGGLLITGYFYIFPTYYNMSGDHPDYEYYKRRNQNYYEPIPRVKGPEMKVSGLITIVGTLLFYGLGATAQKKAQS